MIQKPIHDSGDVARVFPERIVAQAIENLDFCVG
jgi:hypothetical protein